MSEILAKWARVRGTKKPDQEKRLPSLNAGERRALWKMRGEAREAGASLATNGRGGLPPSLVLGVMRRDEYRCKACGGSENLSLHHKSEHMNDPKAKQRSAFLRQRDRVDTPANLVTICQNCHDRIHDKDRQENQE